MNGWNDGPGGDDDFRDDQNDNIGNRAPRESQRPRSLGNETPRSERPADIDDNFGNR